MCMYMVQKVPNCLVTRLCFGLFVSSCISLVSTSWMMKTFRRTELMFYYQHELEEVAQCFSNTHADHVGV